MPQFKYVARDKTGRSLKGYVEAPNERGAIQSLRAQDLIIVSVEEDKSKAAFSFGTKTAKKQK